MNLEQAITTALEYEGRVHRTYSEAVENAEHDVARRVFSPALDHDQARSSSRHSYGYASATISPGRGRIACRQARVLVRNAG